MVELNFPSVHRDDITEVERRNGVPICIINYEQSEARQLAFIRRIIALKEKN